MPSRSWNLLRSLLCFALATAFAGCVPGSLTSPSPPGESGAVQGAQPTHRALSLAPSEPLPTDIELSDPPPDADTMELSTVLQAETDDTAPDTQDGPFAQGTVDTAPVEGALSCPDGVPEPLPSPGTPGSQGFWNTFRVPLPPAPVWNPPGQKRVGLQAGHWLTQEVPPELGRLVTGAGTSGGGKAEWQVTLDIAQRTANLLEKSGVAVDILPTTIPERYRAHVFIAIHADGDLSGNLRGFKIARAGFSAIPSTDDALVDDLYAEYQAATDLPRDDLHISLRMVYYYAFNSRRYCHAIAPGVPAAIIETGFLTSPIDRVLLLSQPDRAAAGIANGVLRFLQRAF
ncbi:MAG: N-acetylmuramoyl-L-alanine amidase [Chloroflexi bacterium]|nr:N-acetylmuramoyl-L-alanine amidase [Chloroflexota bacterium]